MLVALQLETIHRIFFDTILVASMRPKKRL